MLKIGKGMEENEQCCVELLLLEMFNFVAEMSTNKTIKGQNHVKMRGRELIHIEHKLLMGNGCQHNSAMACQICLAHQEMINLPCRLPSLMDCPNN
jgi:hypothetical protein